MLKKISLLDDSYRIFADKDLLMISRPSIKLTLKRQAVAEFNQRDLRKCMRFIRYMSDYDLDMYVYALDQLMECLYTYGKFDSSFIKKMKILQKERSKYDEF